MVHLAIRIARRTMSHLGRETFLTPVIWLNGWPIAGNHRKATLECDGPLWAKQRTEKCMRADFYKKRWEPEWIFLRNPKRDAYVRGDGKLLLIPSKVHFPDQKNPVFAAVRQGNSFLVLEKNADDMYQRACKVPVPEGKLYLRIRGEKEYYYFSYSTDGKSYCEVARASTRFLACEVSGRCFTGTVMGVYAASCRETEAVMEIEAFEVSTVLNG